VRTSSRLWKVLLAALLAMPLVSGGAAYASTEAAGSARSTGSVGSATTAQVALAPKAVGRTVVAAARCCHITIPSNYVYNPNGPRASLHDYCTSSPDEFPSPGGNADFRGSCARHDLCYEFRQQSRLGCDNQFRNHLVQECTYKYAWYDPRRVACVDTAGIYWVAVVANTLWPF